MEELRPKIMVVVVKPPIRWSISECIAYVRQLDVVLLGEVIIWRGSLRGRMPPGRAVLSLPQLA
jgi:hypothetical protein